MCIIRLLVWDFKHILCSKAVHIKYLPMVEIEYIVAGAVCYRATTAGELGVEVTVTEFSMHGKVAPKVY